MKATIYVLICLSFGAQMIYCSCLSYGHSCWGAHGKRSGVSNNRRFDMKVQQDPWSLLNIFRNEQREDVAKQQGPQIKLFPPKDYFLDSAEASPEQPGFDLPPKVREPPKKSFPSYPRMNRIFLPRDNEVTSLPNEYDEIVDPQKYRVVRYLAD